MNKSKFAALAFSLIGLVAALPAAAQSFYFGGSVGTSEAHQDACSFAQNTGSAYTCDRNDTSWSGNLGFMFTQHWGMEFSYRDLGKIVETNDGMGNTAQWKTKAGDAVVVGALPIEKVTLYLKAGAYYAKTKITSGDPNFVDGASCSNKQWTYAGGVRYDIWRHLAVRVEWQRYNNVGCADVVTRGDVNVLSGGLLLVF